jgi:hypothetical protein
MIITNDLIKEASLVQQTNIGNMLALDALSKESYSGSGNKWYDLSGNLNNVTWTNQPAYDSNGYFTFNGTSSYGTAPDSPSLGITGFDITMEVWVRFTSFAGSNETQFPLSKAPYEGGASIDAGNYTLWVDAGSILNSTNDGTGAFLKGFYPTTNSTGVWTQIVFVQNANGYRVIKNGSVLGAAGIGPEPAPLKPTSELLYIGRRKDGSFLYGDLAVVNIWDRALSDVEILQNYNFYRTRFV